jgi:geranylgeranyl diphosphate synthase, type II
VRSTAELRELVAGSLEELELAPELGSLEDPVRYAVGGKLIRPVLCLAAAEAAGSDVEEALPAAIAVELVHSFSLVHDDLPALDDDEVRRGKPTVHAEYGERTAILVGDALLAEAFALASTYATSRVTRELAQATLRMIGGQQLDFDGGADRRSVHGLKTAALFEAPVGCALWIAGIPEVEQAPWRAFARNVGLLFQVVDDLLDGDGLAVVLGAKGARRLADDHAAHAHDALGELGVDTSVLAGIVDSLASRTA